MLFNVIAEVHLIFLMKASTRSQMISSQEESIFSCDLISQSSSSLVKPQLNAIKAQVNSSISNEEIKAFGTSFHTAKLRGFEVIVDAEGRINYTKLLERITGDRQKLKDLCKDNSGVLTIIRSYDEDKLLAWNEKYGLNLMGEIPPSSRKVKIHPYRDQFRRVLVMKIPHSIGAIMRS